MTVQSRMFQAFILQIIIIFFTYLLIPQSVFAQVKLNEVSVDSSPEWVEFYNASQSADYIKSYYVDDDESFTDDIGSSKKLLTGLNITNSTYPYFELSSSVFNNDGDKVVLFDQNGSIIDTYEYTKSPGDNVSLGRSPDNTGNFFILSSQTKGAPNSLPISSPTPTPTPAATPKITPTPSPIVLPASTPKASAIPSPTPKKASPFPSNKSASPASDVEVSPEILGESEIASPSQEASASSGVNAISQFSGLFLILTGVTFSAAAGWFAFKKHKPKVDIIGE